VNFGIAARWFTLWGNIANNERFGNSYFILYYVYWNWRVIRVACVGYRELVKPKALARRSRNRIGFNRKELKEHKEGASKNVTNIERTRPLSFVLLAVKESCRK